MTLPFQEGDLFSSFQHSVYEAVVFWDLTPWGSSCFIGTHSQELELHEALYGTEDTLSE